MILVVSLVAPAYISLTLYPLQVRLFEEINYRNPGPLYAWKRSELQLLAPFLAGPGSGESANEVRDLHVEHPSVVFGHFACGSPSKKVVPSKVEARCEKTSKISHQ